MVLLAPALVLLGVFFAYPVFEILKRTFTDVAPGQDWLENFAWFFRESSNAEVLLRTLITGLVVTASCLVLGFPFAYAIARAGRRLRIVLLGLVVISLWQSIVARLFGFLVILRPSGIVNDALSALGLGRPELLGHTPAVIIALTQVMLPAMILPVYASLTAIDRRLFLAARNLGAPPWRAFTRVYVPLSVPGMMAGGILVFVFALAFYPAPAILGSPSNALLSQSIVLQIDPAQSFGHAGVLSIVLIAATLIAIAIASRFTRGHLEAASDTGTMLAGARDQQEESASTGSLPGRIVLAASVAVGCLFLLAPVVVMTVLSFTGENSYAFPPPSWSTEWYTTFFTDPAWRDALVNSLIVAALTVVASLAIGVPAAVALDRFDFRGKSVVRGLLILPIIVPLVVFAIGAYRVFLGWGLVGSRVGFVIAHTIFALPLVVFAVGVSLSAFDRRLEQAAQSLGASRLAAFRAVTLPAIAPGIFTAAIFAFIASFDELVVALFLSDPLTQTLPVKMFETLRTVDPTVAASSTIVLGVTTAMILLLLIVGGRRGARASI
ncbi:MAG: ABC transporter permease subunit [Solirubrobacterales bacterium]